MFKLSIRLSSVAALVNQDAAIADIGTDHGYIPVYLLKNNIIKSAVASDINEGPLESCRRLVSEYELNDKVRVILSNGLDKLNEKDFDTVIIAGMGGELISEILSKKDYIKSKRLILQPMTHGEIVKKFLYDNGFEIDKDFIVKDGKHNYNIFDAYYTGACKERTRVDYYLGNIKDFSNKEYFVHLLSFLKNKSKSGQDYSDIISVLEKIV